MGHWFGLWLNLFTFYSSSIKEKDPNLLKDIHLLDLHSILVLLEVSWNKGLKGITTGFTFYSSSIKVLWRHKYCKS